MSVLSATQTLHSYFQLYELWQCYLETGKLVRLLDGRENKGQLLASHSSLLIPFSNCTIVLTPRIARLLLSSKSKRLPLGLLMIWSRLYRHSDHAREPTARAWLLAHGIKLEQALSASKYCKYIGVLKNIKSRPDKGHAYARLLHGKRVGG